MAKKKSIILFDKHEELLSLINGDECQNVIAALFAYHHCEDKDGLKWDFCSAAAKIAFTAISQDINYADEKYEKTCARNRENGLKGGRPSKPNKTQQNPKEPTETQANPKDKDKDKDLKKDTPIGVSKEKPAKAESVRHKYGEYENVMLTDEQYEELKDKFPSDYKERIERLSEYMSSTGKVYKNHLTTIKVWARMEKERGKPAPGRARAAPNRSFRSGQENIYSDDIYEVF